MRSTIVALSLAAVLCAAGAGPALAQDYELTVASRRSMLDASRTAPFTFDVRPHPSSTVQRLDGYGRLCVGAAQNWDLVEAVQVPPLARGETKQISARLRALGTWTGTRTATFTAATPGSTCTANGLAPTGQSNRLDESVSTIAMTQSGPSGTVVTTPLTVDRVEVVSLTITPQPAHKDQLLTIKMVGRYKFGQRLDRLQVRVRRGNETIGLGHKENLTAHSTFEITATWRGVPGTHTFTGDVDIDNLLGESGDQRANNSKSATVTVSDQTAPRTDAPRGTAILTGTGPGAGGDITPKAPAASDVPKIARVRTENSPLGWVGIALVCNAKTSIVYDTARDGRRWYSGTPNDFHPGNFNASGHSACPSNLTNRGAFEVQFPIDKWQTETCWVQHTFTVTGGGGSDSFTFKTAGKDQCRGPRPPFNR